MIEAIAAESPKAAEATAVAAKEGLAKVGMQEVGRSNPGGDAGKLAVGGNVKSVLSAMEIDPEALGAEVRRASPAEQKECRNARLEGQTHPETGVPLERQTVELRDGTKVEGVFPKFEFRFECNLDEDLEHASDHRHKTHCNEQLSKAVGDSPQLKAQFSERQLEQIANGDTPDGYTWHHHQEPGKMQLVNTEVHMKTGHTGGKEIWGGGSENR